MKKTTYIIAAGFALLASCSDFLDEDLQGVYSSSTFYQSAEHAELALTACYEPLAFKSIENNLWVFGDVASDDAIKGGNEGDQSEITYINNFETTSDNGYILSIWTHYYTGIARCNEAIDNIPGIDMDEDLGTRYVAEAKFLRAWYYFQLVNIFGEIPLRTEAIESSDDLDEPLSAVDDIFGQIEEDLLDAIAGLPDTPVSGEYGRATRGAAFGMMAKTYLYLEDYSSALAWCDSLEDLQQYGLMELYSQNFSVDYENNRESIFEIQHLAGQDPFLGSALNQWFAPATENGYYFDVPVEGFVTEFEMSTAGVYDPRLDYTVGRDGQLWLNGEDFDPSWSPTGYLQKKHLQPLDEIGKGTKGDGDLNYTYMRYAEILLIRAEALNELNRPGEALEALNQVRQRARESYLYDEDLPGYGSVPSGLLNDVETTEKTALTEAIRHERRVELGFEFHRFFDLMRYGKTVAEEALSDTKFSYDEHRYFPIPQNETDININID